MDESRKTRIKNALRGLFCADALAMPAHWFYKIENIYDTFEGGITGYEAPPHPHPESFMVGMGYHPDVETASSHGRPFDILHDHVRFYDTSYSDLEIKTGERESEHGNSTPSLDDRYHYHHNLKAGENTTAAQLVRVLLRSIAREGRYDEASFLDDFVSFLTTPGNLRDPYLEIYLRAWFANYSKGTAIDKCAARQRDIWSIGSHGGMIRPLVVSLLGNTDYLSLGMAIEHQNLTHRSENVSAALGVAVPLLHDLLRGFDPLEATSGNSETLRVPETTGEEMFRLYRENEGPGNIPSREMWNLHTKLSTEPFDVRKMAKQSPDEVVLKQLGTACYPEQGLPLALYFAAHHEFRIEDSLLANVNAGGDNVHRNAVLGLIVGAANLEFPQHLLDGLFEKEAIEEEIDAFLEVAGSEHPW